MLAATEPQVIRQLRVMGHQWWTQPHQDLKIETDLVASATGHHITSSNAVTTQIGAPPPQPHAPATTPAAPPTPHQHRHQQRRNALTHATTIEGSPGQQRTAQKRRPGHCGPWVMSQQTLYKGGGGGRRLLPLPNCGDAYEGELAPVPNP